MFAVRPQVIETFKPSALTLPIANLILDKIERGGAAKIRDWKDRLEDGLQSRVLAFLRQEIHLQKTVVRLALNLDQIRDSHRRRYLGKVHALRRLARAFS
jgi:hypothetical protein